MESLTQYFSDLPGYIWLPALITGLVSSGMTLMTLAFIGRRRNKRLAIEQGNEIVLSWREVKALEDSVTKLKHPDVKGPEVIKAAFAIGGVLERKKNMKALTLDAVKSTKEPLNIAKIQPMMGPVDGVEFFKADIKEIQGLGKSKGIASFLNRLKQEAVKNKARTFARITNDTKRARGKVIHRWVENGQTVLLAIETSLRNVRPGDVITLADGPEFDGIKKTGYGMLSQVASLPYRNQDGVLQVNTNQIKDPEAWIESAKKPLKSEDNLIAWSRRVMEPAGLHGDTELHLRQLYQTGGNEINGQKRKSGRSTALALYAAYIGRDVPREVEDDGGKLPGCKMKSALARQYVAKALKKGWWFPGGQVVLQAS